MNLIADPPQALYLVLAAVLVVTGAVAAQRQDKRTVTAFAIAFFLMLVLFLIDRFVESPREEAVRRTHMIAQAADAKKPEDFVEHVADTVTIHAGGGEKTLTREELRNHPFWTLLRHHVANVSVKNFSRDDAREIDENTVEIGFMGHGTLQGGQTVPVYCRATYSKQTDGSYKLSALRLFEAVERNRPLHVPGFP